VDAAPPAAELEAVIREPFSPERARAVLFAPGAGHGGAARLYPRLVCSPPPGAPPEHPQARLQGLCLTLLSLVHKHDKDFVFDFVLNDGVLALAQLVSHTDLSIRARALESLISVTSSEDLDWFKAPPGPRQQRIHPHLLKVTQFDFVGELLRNADDSYPGGGFQALQIVGFYLSWLRLFYCKDNILRVSRDILGPLHAWSQRSDLVSDEQTLAKQLYDDFKRFPAEDNDDQAQRGSELLVDQRAVEDATVLAETSLAEEAKPLEGAAQTLSLRAQGNACFAEKKYEEAVELYTSAVSQIDGTSSKDEAKLFGNIAATHMELWRSTACDDAGRQFHLNKCVEFARKAALLDYSYAKARYRLAQALLELRRFDEAEEEIERGREVATNGTEIRSFSALARQLDFARKDSPERRKELMEIYSAILSRYGQAPSRQLTSAAQKVTPEGEETSGGDGAEEEVKRDEDLSKDMVNESREKMDVPRLKSPSLRLSNLAARARPEIAEQLGAISEEQFISLFGNNLDEPTLTAVVEAADSLLPGQPSQAFLLLDRLARVERFELVLMFLPQKVHDRLASTFAILRSALVGEADRVRQVALKYQ